MPHILTSPRLGFNSEIPSAFCRSNPQRTEKGQVPDDIMAGGIPIHPAVVKKPSGTLAEADAAGNPCKEKEQRAAQRLMRRERDLKPSASQNIRHAPHPRQSPPHPSFVVRNDRIDVRIAHKNTLSLRGAEHGQFRLWKK